jgi:membrane fusion protein, copper/silver efflux system
MKKVMYFGVVFVLLAGIMAAFANRGRQIPAKTAESRKILYYVDPMHPAYKSDKPGTAPDCGMELVPVYEDAVSESTASAAPANVTNEISERQRQLIGVQVNPAQVSSPEYRLRLLGRVMPDDTRVYKLNAGIDGYIQDVSAVVTGSVVKKDQLLATFAAPNAAMTIQSYLLNLGAEDRFKKNAAEGSSEGQALTVANANIQQRVQQLRNIGISPVQIAEMKRTREVPDSIQIVAPADGILLSRDVSPGQKFDRGAEWFRIADLTRIWIVADVPDADVKYLRAGMRVQISSSALQQRMTATVGEILPQTDTSSGTSKVRLHAENPGYLLRPGMFVDVAVTIPAPRVLTVPTDAVLDSGLKKTILVQRSDGRFESRVVETGRRFDSQIEITKGLRKGEHIVTAGTFLLDSDSRLRNSSRN